MELILWRHAQAQALEDNPALPSDAKRPLTAKGRQQAKKMAQWLNQVLPRDCTILVSPSQRTIETVEALARPFTLVEEVGTQSTVEQILTACNWPNAHQSILIVGHQPQLGQVVQRLLPALTDCAIRKGNVWWISQKSRGHVREIFLKAVMGPELVGTRL